MSSDNKLSKFDAKKTTQTEPSPWTEVFQRSQDNQQHGSESSESQAQSDATRQAPAEHMDQDTHDALSAIFNG